MNGPNDRAPLILRKGEERRLLAGHLWIYSNEIDTARSPLKSFEPGQPVDIVGARGQWLAHAYVNPHSLIAARITGWRPERPLNAEELLRRLRAAADWRGRLYRAPCYRWAYGESDALPGLVVDRYGDVVVVQINTAGMERLRGDIVDALSACGARAVLLRCDGDLRVLEGLPTYVETALGEVPEEAVIEENGVRFAVPLLAGQKTGWFYDQSDNRLRARPLFDRGTIIDAFSYAGGWGIQAALAGARRVICIDSSELALDYARRNAELNGVADRVHCLRSDLSEALAGMEANERCDAIVVDPPAFAKRKKDVGAATAAYRKLNELALALLADGGFLVSCSCSHHVDRDAFVRLVQKAGRRAGCDLQLLIEGGQSADHPVHPAMPETRYLKALMLRVDKRL